MTRAALRVASATIRRARYLLPMVVMLAGCAGTPAVVSQLPADQPPLRLIGMQQLAADLRHDGILVGGISGMDYDAHSDEWLLASDDRGQHGAARWYRARVDLRAGDVGEIAITRTVILRQPDGTPYPASGQPGVPADMEALRIDPLERSIWVTSEGDRKARVPSFVRSADANGNFLGELPYPAALQIRPDCECGGRSNQGMEGMSFSHDGRQIWLAMEAPAIQDGPVAGPGQGALTRISLMERDGRVAAQFAYSLDAAPAPQFAGGLVDNGISDILAIGPRGLLVLERAGRQIMGNRFSFSVRLYEVELFDASLLDPDTPIDHASVRPGVKRLLFDSADLPQGWADNYEAMAWGPALPSGRRSLMMASDNNFNGGPTRFLLFDAGPSLH